MKPSPICPKCNQEGIFKTVDGVEHSICLTDGCTNLVFAKKIPGKVITPDGPIREEDVEDYLSDLDGVNPYI